VRDRPFIDSNIILYAWTDSGPKGSKALAVLADGGRISVQTMNEIINVARKRFLWPWQDIERRLADLDAICGEPLALTPEAQSLAVRIAKQTGYRIYDAQIVASAVAARCDTLFSEDLQHGRVVEGVRIVNPFLD
jgi:predicted nucleic acid-binding protein